MTAEDAAMLEYLGLTPDQVSVGVLVELAQEVLGAARADRAVQAVRSSPVVSRRHELSGLAALIAGTRILGERWWITPLPLDFEDIPPSGPAPDAVLSGETEYRRFYPAFVVDGLGSAIADSAAAPTVLIADLNFPSYRGVVEVPDGAVVGDRFPVSYDAGARLDAVVQVGADGELETILDLDTAHYSPPALVSFAVHTALGEGRHLLPGESAGTSTDPYQAPIPAARADLDVLEAALAADGYARHLATVGDAVDARAALGTALLHDVDSVLWQVLVGRPEFAEYTLRRLRERYGAR